MTMIWNIIGWLWLWFLLPIYLNHFIFASTWVVQISDWTRKFHETTVLRLNGGPNWIRFGHHSRSEDGIETEAMFPGAIRLFYQSCFFHYLSVSLILGIKDWKTIKRFKYDLMYMELIFKSIFSNLGYLFELSDKV